MPAAYIGLSRRARSTVARASIGVTVAVLALTLIGFAGGWAAKTLLSGQADVLDSPGYTLVEARRGAVGQTLRLNASVEWSAQFVAPNSASGTVTTVDVDAGEVAEPGDVLYSVDLRPVVVAVGDVPAFRDLRSDDHGADVEQLQALLRTLGYSSAAPDGDFGAATARAVRAWQRDLGVTADGVVRRGDLVFVPELPARVALVPELAVGSALAGGEPAVELLPAAPSFRIALADNQAQLVSEGTVVEIEGTGGAPWVAEIAGVERAEAEAGWTAILRGESDHPICGDDCDVVPVGERTLLSSLVHIVPEVEGVTIPAAAIVTTAHGDAGVVLESGEFRPVRVVASATGSAVVEGISIGERVRTPGSQPVAEQPSPGESP